METEMNDRPLQVLIADDEESHIMLISRALTDSAALPEIRAVGSLREYRESVAAQPPDIALVDLNLPDGSAVEVLSQPPVDAPFPVVVMTSFGTQEIVVDVMKAGALDYVVKSSEVFAAMPHTIERVLREWRLMQDHKRAQTALQESLRQYQEMFEGAYDGIITINTEGKLLSVNKSFASMHGYSVAEMKNMSLRDLDTPDNARLIPERMRRLLAGEKLTFDVEHYHKDGHTFPLEVSNSVIVVNGQKLIQCFHRDITERKLAEAERNKIQTRLLHSQKMESVGRLAGGVAHDFNNIVATIKGFAEFLREDLPEQADVQEDIREIMKAADRAATLTSQLFAFSRIQVLSPHIVDLNLILVETGKMLSRLIGENIRLTIDPSPVPCAVKIDPGQIEQVIMNLALNARDAMPAGGELSMRIRLGPPDQDFLAARPGLPECQQVCLTVSDTGHGMTEEIKSHIFEPFFTTKEHGSGVGLGLSTAYGTIKQNGGEIGVESAPGAGSVFRICLPRAEGAVQATGHLESQARTPGGRETILVVDDDNTFLRVASRILSESGYTVLTASRGREALKLLEARGRPVDLLLSDVVMPDMNGRELAREVLGRKDEKMNRPGGPEPDPTVIFKPFSHEDLRKRLREVLDGPHGLAGA